MLRTPHQRCDITNQSIIINGTPLGQIGQSIDEPCTKFLGVQIDEFLSWNFQLKQINKKLSRALFAIKQVKHFLPVECLRTLYFSMIHPHLTYGILAWGNASQSLLNRTIVLQKRALRTINRVAYNSHTQPLFKYMKILNLADQYEYEAALFMFKYVNNRLPLSFDHAFQFNHEVQTSHQTRQSSQMQVKRCNSNFAKKLPLFSFPIIWNKWSHKLIANMSVYKFKSLIKSSLLSKYPEYVKCDNLTCKQCNGM